VPAITRSFEPLEFAAPIGRRVRIVTALVMGILIALAVMPAFVAGGRLSSTVGPWVAPVIAAPLIGVVLLLAVVRSYRLTDRELEIVRIGRITRYPLRGLMAAEVDRDAIRQAWKTWGNDGLGAVTGRFRSQKLGAFEALLTDSQHAVVLRWPGRTLVISPERETYFVELVRERANLGR
jgi:hypothetical protein